MKDDVVIARARFAVACEALRKARREMTFAVKELRAARAVFSELTRRGRPRPAQAGALRELRVDGPRLTVV